MTKGAGGSLVESSAAIRGALMAGSVCPNKFIPEERTSETERKMVLVAFIELKRGRMSDLMFRYNAAAQKKRSQALRLGARAERKESFSSFYDGTVACGL
jgi:hypothetical protein